LAPSCGGEGGRHGSGTAFAPLVLGPQARPAHLQHHGHDLGHPGLDAGALDVVDVVAMFEAVELLEGVLRAAGEKCGLGMRLDGAVGVASELTGPGEAALQQ
jgi:hypothetical protein